VGERVRASASGREVTRAKGEYDDFAQRRPSRYTANAVKDVARAM
jgi:hypothetical protein